jgi:predicted dehydrogenase
MGIVGGGGIGTVHQVAARLNGTIELVAGAFSSNAERSKRSGEHLGLHPSRVHDDYRAMAADERIDFVSIVTPNHLHFPVAKAFLEAGFNVVCDEPMTFDLAEALELRGLVKESGKVFALTHNDTGYPVVKEAREIVRRGELGKMLKVVTEYPRGWLLNPLEAKSQEQVWRNDPSKAGATGCLSDIGTHVEHLARYVTGSRSMNCAPTSPNSVPANASKATPTSSSTIVRPGSVQLRVRGARTGNVRSSYKYLAAIDRHDLTRNIVRVRTREEKRSRNYVLRSSAGSR